MNHVYCTGTFPTQGTQSAHPCTKAGCSCHFAFHTPKCNISQQRCCWYYSIYDDAPAKWCIHNNHCFPLSNRLNPVSYVIKKPWPVIENAHEKCTEFLQKQDFPPSHDAYKLDPAIRDPFKDTLCCIKKCLRSYDSLQQLNLHFQHNHRNLSMCLFRGGFFGVILSHDQTC